jgi:hypothetical protein
MPATDERPPAAIGHVRFNVTDVEGASRWLATVGLRTIVSSSDLAVLELRGGTHLVVRQAERPPEPRTGAPFDSLTGANDTLHCRRQGLINLTKPSRQLSTASWDEIRVTARSTACAPTSTSPEVEADRHAVCAWPAAAS